jgi:hypothetical protein
MRRGGEQQRGGWPTVIALLALGVTLPGPAAGTDARSRWRFDATLLAGFEIEIEPAVEVLELAAVAPSGFTVLARGRDFEGLAGGSIRHADGFTLRRRGATVVIGGIEIRPGARPRSLALVDGAGAPLFAGERMHFDYDPAARRVRLSKIDLELTPELAARLGAPALTGVVLGRLELEASALPVEGAAAAGEICSDPVWDGAVNVRLSGLSAVQQVAREGGRVAVSLATELENPGAADVPWRRKFSGAWPPHGNDQHPYLVWALYRIAATGEGEGGPTAIQMLGRSALKHAFFATNADCSCPGDQILWAPLGGPTHDTAPCTDTYGTGSNNDPNALGPRDELEAHSGLWTSTGSFFDQDGDGVCDWDRTSGIDTNGDDCDDLTFSSPFDRRLAVAESELAVTGATYYVDAWYVVRGDVDIFDTMGWRRIAPSCDAGGCTFALETALAAGSPLDAWVPRAAPPPGTAHERIDAGFGHLSLAARTTDLGGGWFRYEYALANHDLDRKVRSFRVPLPPGAAVTNAGFSGVDGEAAPDWSATVAADAVAFDAPAPAETTALDWGTLFAFRLDADVAPASGSVDLGALEQNPGLELAGPTLTPGGALGRALFQDGFESGAPARWSATAP